MARHTTWDPDLLRGGLKAADMSSARLARALSRAGWRYTPQAVRSWLSPRSPGPPHPAAVAAVWELVGGKPAPAPPPAPPPRRVRRAPPGDIGHRP